MKGTKDYKQYNNTVCSKKIFTLPNVLSVLRIVMIPVLVALYLYENYLWSGIMLVLSAITDVVDGVIARKFNLVTELGKALDPIADKLTQLAVLACLAMQFNQIWLIVALLIVKEAFTGITQLLIFRKQKVVVGADWYGKITTVFIYLFMFIHIVWSIWGQIPNAVSWAFITVSVILMIFSLVLYAIRNIRIIRKGEKVKEEKQDE